MYHNFIKCVTSVIEEVNLKTIPDIMKKYGLLTGLSDHTLTTSAPIAAVALGAKLIEKHFIIDRGLGGPDSAFSLEPDEFENMVDSIRETEKALGKVSYELSEKTKISRKYARSLFVIKDIKGGKTLTKDNVRSIRPGFGLYPKYLKDVLGKSAIKDIKKGTPLKWDLIK
ncbi:MAG: hypothetical protein IEMM0003_0656 [bacterium]|nr:MAG: hypothetical protein IEMM0003_0656 [bacterium]